MGKLSTPEKYEAHRAEMAESVWHQFRDNDSKFCRSCHSWEAMDFDGQGRSTARKHRRALDAGQTCIDCHYGLAHALPENADEIMERLQAEYAPPEEAE